MNFFDLGLRLAARGHFLIFWARYHAGFRRGYSELSEAKILEDRYTFMGSGSIFCFGSMSLSLMVPEI